MTVVAPIMLCVMTGCTSMGGFHPPWKKSEAKNEVPQDSIILTGARGLEREPVSDAVRQEFDAAKRLFDEKKYAEAEPLFRKLIKLERDPNWWELGLFDDPKASAKNKQRRGGDPICEASLFYEAECQRLQKDYRTASNTYTKLLAEFPTTQYSSVACQGMFEIAHHWLGPTSRQMDEYHEQLLGKRSFVMPAMYFHWDKDMPMMDAEGHATNLLNKIRVHNIKGPLAEKALFMLGTVSFFRKEYKDADFYFTQLFEQHPDSAHAAKAIKQAVICKQLATGGTEYDLRALEESKKLLMNMQGAYPELARDQKWIETQLASMNIQQADRDFKIAEFYRRTGHPGSAYFYYELVIRRYPRTDYAAKATERKAELKNQVEREQRSQTTPPAPNPTLQTNTTNPPRILPPLFEPGKN
jgi:outer membrane protein assembly factor BamD (BamD/ComL family)